MLFLPKNFCFFQWFCNLCFSVSGVILDCSKLSFLFFNLTTWNGRIRHNLKVSTGQEHNSKGINQTSKASSTFLMTCFLAYSQSEISLQSASNLQRFSEFVWSNSDRAKLIFGAEYFLSKAITLRLQHKVFHSTQSIFNKPGNFCISNFSKGKK